MQNEPGFQFRNSRPGPCFIIHFTNTYFQSKHKSWVEQRDQLYRLKRSTHKLHVNENIVSITANETCPS